MASKEEQLNTAINRLYGAFGKYRPSPELEERIGPVDLRNLMPADIEALGCADLMGLSIYDTKFLLPRILELLLLDDYPARPEAVLSNLGTTDWRCWQRNERSALERFLVAAWQFLLSEPVPVERIDQWLCASMQVFDDPERFVEDELTYGWWIQPLRKAAHYARLITLNYEALKQGQTLANPYWTKRKEQMLETSRWLVSEYEINGLDRIIEEHPYEPVSDDLRQAAYYLEELHNLPHKERPKPPIPNASDFVRESKNASNSGISSALIPAERLDKLDAAISALYQAFKSYGRRPTVARDIGSGPLEELTSSDLVDFARDVMITKGRPDDFKHFLPRILELMLQPGWPIRPEGIMFKMLLADYHMWPETERAAIDAYVKAVWPILLSDPNYPVSAEEWLCGASTVIKGGESPGSGGSETIVLCAFMDFPDLWRTLCCEDSTPAMLHWSRFITSNYEALMNETRLRNRFCNYRPADVPRAVRWMLSGSIVAGYLRNRNREIELPEGIAHGLECMDRIWKKRARARHSACDISVHCPEEGLEIAREISDPWFRCQELAGVARNTSDSQIRDIALRESFVAGAETNQPNRIVIVSSWPLAVLLDVGPMDWFDEELTRLLEIIRCEPHPYRRIDALNWLLYLAFKGAPEVYPEVIAGIKRGADEAHGWRVAYLLLIASRLASVLDHDSAIEIAMMIRNLRTRRRALRAINERQLAEQQY